MDTSIPTSNTLLTSALSHLAARLSTNQPPYHPLPSPIPSLPAPDLSSTKSVLIALHFLFPHELLPTLDILDRGLVNRLLIAPDSIEVFYVQSASAVTLKSTSRSNKSRYKNAFNPSSVYYEVRLDAWNCSCPAFAFSAFGRDGDEDEDESPDGKNQDDEREGLGWAFGGTLTRPGTVTPTCKHILAAVLGKQLPSLFGAGVVVKEVSAVAAAGWAAGWAE